MLIRLPLPRVLNWILLCLVAAAVGGALHEGGHFLAAVACGYEPTLSFAGGGYVKCGVAGELVPATHEAVILTGGPLATFALAIVATLLYCRCTSCFALFAFAMWNGLFRLTALIDGSRSDEAKLSAVLGLPLPVFPAVSVIASLAIGVYLLRKQQFFKQTLWALPIAFVAMGIAFRGSFMLLEITFG
jgi:hypothetical protein